MVLALVRPQLALSDPNTQSAAEAVNVELEVVIAGTATRAPLFQDAAGAVPLAQPIRTGARGFTQEFYVEVDTLTTVLAWRSGGLQGGFLTIEGQAAALAQDAVDRSNQVAARAITGARGVNGNLVLKTEAGTDLAPIPMPKGEQGDKGLPGVLAVPAAEAVGAYITDGTTPAGEASRALAAGFSPAIRVNSARFAIDDTGTVDATSALAAISAAAPRGSVLKLEGTYKIDGTWDIDPTKFLTIDFADSNLIHDGTAFSAIRCIGSFQDQVPVSTITSETIRIENKDRTLTRLTTGTATGWKRGDVVKVIADNVIPGAHITSTTNQPRVGEFATVYSADAGSVLLSGPLTEPFTTNIRVARLNPGSVNILNPQVDTSDTRITAKTAGRWLALWNLTMPRVVRPRMKRLSGMGISMKSNYGYYIEAPEGDYAMDDTSTGNLGYFIHDSGCVDGVIVGGTLTGGRHAFTDGSGDVPTGSTDTSSYGATMNTKLIGVTAKAMKAACFDTHHQSRGVQFIDCTAYPLPEEDGFLLRGRDVSVINPTVYGGTTVVRVINQDTTTGGVVWSRGESYGHRLINARSYGTKQAWYVYVHNKPEHPAFGVRSDRVNLTVVGGEHFGLETPWFIWNSWVRQTGTTLFEYGERAVGSGMRSRNSIVDTESLRVDGRKVTTVQASQAMFYIDDDTGMATAFLSTGKFRVAGSTAFRAGFLVPFNILAALTERVFIDDLIFEDAWTSTTPFAAAEGVNASVRWRVILPAGDAARFRSSRALTYTNAGIEGTLRNLFRSHDERLTMTLANSDGTARQLMTLPEGKFVGQQLTILCGATGANITVKNGATGGTALAGSADKVLNTLGQVLDLFWSGTAWRQRVAV